MPSISKTMVLVKAALSGQYDKSGVSKFEHCVRVATNMQKLMKQYDIEDQNYVLVALLHDIIEDSDITDQDLYLFGFNKQVVDAINLLTHENDDISYVEYIDKLCQSKNLMALLGKLADNLDNTDELRYVGLDEKFCEYLKHRYGGVRIKLEEAINNLT